MSQEPKAFLPVVHRAVLSLALLGVTSPLFATSPQERDVVKWGANTFRTPQLPLERKIARIEEQIGHLLLKPTVSTNNKGYTATWSIGDNILYLEKFRGSFGDREVPIKEIIGQESLPVRASWYSGTLQLPVGEFDFKRQAWPVLIELTIRSGEVVDVRAVTFGKELEATAPDADLD